jgi:asparagine synthase (glutamine-hydrolysing)
MCGLAGIIETGALTDAAETRLRAMTRALAHRGPDAEGYWLDKDRGVALGHRRLSILDLSSAGAQPMHSACGRFVIAFNGEIYNHLTLRQGLEESRAAPDWRGHSDTETLLAAIVHWGLETALQKARGMFAFALWDSQERALILARDRMGEKPLYYVEYEKDWLFGSELRALVAGGLSTRIDRLALGAYLRLGYVPDHLCILAGVRKVMPGGIVVLRAGAQLETMRYDAIEQSFGQRPLITDADQAVSALEQVMEGVVCEQMLSDVPLGCFLSGGVDSSLVASLMQAGSDRQIHSFSIGFEDPRFNEAPHAAAVASHLGTAHTEFTLREEDALAIVPDLAHIYDEPFADSSQIPTTLLCRAAREHVTVALTGDGGDEVFGGYNRHIRGPALWSTINRIPSILRTAAAGVVTGSARFGRRHELATRRALAALGLPLTTLDKLPKLATALQSAGHAEAFYQSFVEIGPELDDVLLPPVPAMTVDPRARHQQGMALAEWLMARDVTGYLPGDILVKVDRAAMSASLETRAPFLDARVSDVARQIPVALHVDGREGKKLVRTLLYRHVPRALIERPKQGFAMPIDDWLRGALRQWAEVLITDVGLVSSLGLNKGRLVSLWQDHQCGRVNAGRELWILLMLLLWAKIW